MTFLFGNDTSRNNRQRLRQRRQWAEARRLLIAVSAGLLAWSVLQCISGMIATDTVVLAQNDIHRGDVLTSSSLAMQTVPHTAVLDDAATNTADLEGRVANIDIAAGMPILQGMTGAMPAVAAGFTSMQVPLASAPQMLHPGDHIHLVSEGKTLAAKATVIRLPEEVEQDEFASPSEQPLAVTITVAVTAEEAMAILAAQEDHPILAVSRQAS